MLAVPDPLIVLSMPHDGTQNDLLMMALSTKVRLHICSSLDASFNPPYGWVSHYLTSNHLELPSQPGLLFTDGKWLRTSVSFLSTFRWVPSSPTSVCLGAVAGH